MPGFILNDGAVVPPSVYSDMNTVLNKKLGTSQVYPPRDWAAIVKDLVPLPLKSASGSIAHFEDGADAVPLKSLTYRFTPTQAGSGDPSPSNPRAINAVSSANVVHVGANLWSGSSTISKDNTQPYIVVPCVLKAGTYTVSGNITSDTDGVRLYFHNGSTAIMPLNIATATGYGTVTLTSDVTEFSFFGQQSNTGSNAASIANFQIEVGSTPTAYEPFTSTTHPVDFGTVYGGEGNEAGEFVNKYALGNLSLLTWTYNSQWNRFHSSVLSGLKTPPDNKTLANLYCSHFKTVTSNQTADAGYDNSIGVSSTGVIQIRDTSLNGDTSALETLLQNVEFVYELATPATLSVDPVTISSRLGANNIYLDLAGSEIECEYYADPTLSTL